MGIPKDLLELTILSFGSGRELRSLWSLSTLQLETSYYSIYT